MRTSLLQHSFSDHEEPELEDWLALSASLRWVVRVAHIGAQL